MRYLGDSSGWGAMGHDIVIGGAVDVTFAGFLIGRIFFRRSKGS